MLLQILNKNPEKSVIFVFKLYQYSEQHLRLSSKPISTGTYFKVLQSISKYAAQQHCTICKLLHSLIYINADKKPGYQLSPLSRGLDDFSIILSTKKCFKSKYTLKIILNADTHLLRIIQNMCKTFQKIFQLYWAKVNF